MPRLKACGQGSEAPAHRQLRQCPTGKGTRERLEPLVSDLVFVKVEACELRQGATGTGVRESRCACIRDLVAVEVELLCKGVYRTSNKTSEPGECVCQGSGHGSKAVASERTSKCASDPPATALQRAITPTSLI